MKNKVASRGGGKLLLGKETLRRLSAEQLEGAAGGSLVGTATGNHGLCQSGGGGCGGTVRCHTTQLTQIDLSTIQE